MAYYILLNSYLFHISISYFFATEPISGLREFKLFDQNYTAVQSFYHEIKVLIALMKGRKFSLSIVRWSVSCLICFLLTNISTAIGMPVTALTFEMRDA